MNVYEPSGNPSEPVDPENFTGRGTLERMLGVCRSPAANAYRVTFEAGARTAWHTHSGPQLLVVVDGRCRFQRDGMPVQEIDVGGVVSIEPHERHWHGAAANTPTTHIAINIQATTEWLAKVTDAEYLGVDTA